MTTANPLEVDVDPECVRGMHQAAELLASLGHEVEEAAPLHARQGRAGAVHLRLRARPSRSASPTASCSPAARRPTTRSSRCRARSSSRRRRRSSVGYLGAVAQLQALARGDRRVLRRVRPAAHARRWPSARWRSATAPASASSRWPTSPARARSRRSRRCSTSRASRRSRSRSASARTTCRPACRSSASRSARTRCCRSPRRSRPRGPWAHQRPPEP